MFPFAQMTAPPAPPAVDNVNAAPIALDPKKVRRILICQLRQIGDVLLTTPSVALLAKRFPEAELHFFTEKKCLPMLEGNPHITRVWALDKKRLPTLLHEIAFYRRIAAQKFDLVVDFQQVPRCRWVVGFSRAPVRLSFTPPWYNRPLYTHWADTVSGYAAQSKASVLAPLGIQWNGERPELFFSPAERQEAAAFLTSLGLNLERPFMTIDATHRHSTRRWPAPSYARLIDGLADALPGMQFLLPAGPGEEKLVEELRAMCTHKDSVFFSRSVISLRLVAACMAHAAMHIGNCSSPRHIAVAAGVPTLTLIGSTGTGWTFPAPEHIHMQAGVPCQNCNKNTCQNNLVCLTELTPERVLPVALAHFKAFAR